MAADPRQAHVAKELAAASPQITCAFDPKGRFVFGGGEDQSITRWALEADQKVVLKAHDSWVMALAFLPDGETMISGAGDDHLIWWPVAAEKPEPIRRIKAHAGWIRAISVSSDGKLLASAGNDRAIRLWNSADGTLVREWSGPERDVYTSLFHRSGEWLITGDLMGQVIQWEVSTGKKARVFDASPLHIYEGGQQVHYGGVRGLSLSADGKWLLAGGLHKATNPLGNVQEPRVLRFEWESAKLLRQHAVEGMAAHTIWGTAAHPDGFAIGCIGGNSGHLLFWNEADEKPFHKFDLPNTARGVALHPDGLRVATAHFDNKVRLSKLAPKEQK